MSVYSLLRIIHGYWRWAVFVLALMVFVRSLIGVVAHRGWSRDDDLTMRRFFNALDLQVFLGLVLYFFFSPFWLATYQTFGETMRSPVARFFGVEHETAMLLAALAAHVGWHRAKLAATDTSKHRIVAVAMAIFFTLRVSARQWSQSSTNASRAMLATPLARQRGDGDRGFRMNRAASSE